MHKSDRYSYVGRIHVQAQKFKVRTIWPLSLVISILTGALGLEWKEVEIRLSRFICDI